MYCGHRATDEQIHSILWSRSLVGVLHRNWLRKLIKMKSGRTNRFQIQIRLNLIDGFELHSVCLDVQSVRDVRSIL